jgi:hypothetical protein
MSIEEQDAVIGRVTREGKETERRLAALKSEAKAMGDLFSRIGYKLKDNPEAVFFEGQAVPAEIIAMREAGLKATDVDAGRLMALTDDIRNTAAKLADLRRQARDLGI